MLTLSVEASKLENIKKSPGLVVLRLFIEI
jgi:hypothetical protein